MDLITPGTYGESALLTSSRNAALRRLRRAEEKERETRPLPPGNEDRDRAIQELRYARCHMAEMEA